jgi:hypothetical protein
MSRHRRLLALASILTLGVLGTSPARAQGFGYAPGGGLYGGYQSVTSTSVVVTPPAVVAPAPVVVPSPVVVPQPVVVPRPVVVARPYYGGYRPYYGGYYPYRVYGGYRRHW